MEKKGIVIISPIAIDMGAKNTGVYYAKYPAGSTFDRIEKHGQVLVYGNYTALLKARTANRHVRRGYQRKKLAKRLLTLVLEQYFNFPAKQHSQAIGWLLNRRGFSFLEEQYDKGSLNNFPDDAWKKLSSEVQELLGKENNNIADTLMQLAKDCPEKIKKIFEGIKNIKDYKNFKDKESKIKADFVYYDYVEKINKACEAGSSGKSIDEDKLKKSKGDKQKLSETSKWIVERLNKELNLGLKTDKGYQTNLIKQINSGNAKGIKQKLSDFEKERQKVKNRETENNKSVWNFNFSKFEFNNKNEKGLDEGKAKTHLHHFCYAVYKINNEIISGGRHRSKFFEEIWDDLEEFDKPKFLKGKHSPEYLVKFIRDIQDDPELNIEKLHKLVCHISNFELKPLRAYFNDETPIERRGKEKISHKNGDQFSDKKLSRLTSTWFLNQWIVNEEKDTLEKVDSYKKLRRRWQAHQDKDDVIAFWLDTDPTLTIPPYQAIFNRRPPKCQSLLLNINYLNDKYPNWKDWLRQLKPDQEYEEKLKALKIGKGRLVKDELIQIRQLQLILDTSKKKDEYKLNEIWGIHHKIQQLKKGGGKDEEQEWQEKLEQTIEDSELTKNKKLKKLKDDLKFDSEGSFGHFLNKYYQTRRKARDGRYFLIQEKKEKWLSDGQLLILCPHRPRQKKYQWQIDLAAVLGIDRELLIEKTGKQAPEDYFSDIKNVCKDSAKAQKDHRGELRSKLENVLAKREKGEKLEKDLNQLANLADRRCHKSKTELVKITGVDDLLANKQAGKIDRKIALVFKFAQIHNIVFKERSGFSKTCPVCSTDNAFRMQEDNEGFAQASRLPALSIRLIDGVVMRVCDAISRQIAKTKWNDIKGDLTHGKQVTIPLILEQNRFEFEPSLARIKGKKPGDSKDDRDTEFSEKEQRIKKAARRISAYSGKPLGNNDGEFDHIIPRASKYGTLNDEANLIYLSNEDNQKKQEQSKFLEDLHKTYKEKIFGKGKTDDDIKQIIYDQLIGEGKKPEDLNKDDDNFKFGRYLSFINLNEEQQKAFRHALFLFDDDPLKQRVINALQNRNRTIVNGTQRYLAQCIADKLYKIAKSAGKEKHIKFDYFEYNALADRENSTYELRKYFEESKPEIKKDKKQSLHSHLIDAQMAFLLAVQSHQHDGTMGLTFGQLETIQQGNVDTDTGEFNPTKFFDLSFIDKDFEQVDLNRGKNEEGFRLNRSFHRPNFYAQNYVPLFLGKKEDEIEIRAGFSWENSAPIKTTKRNMKDVLSILQFAKNKLIVNGQFDSLNDLYDGFNKKAQCEGDSIFYIDWDKTAIQKYLVDNFSSKAIANGKTWSSEIKFLDKLSYRVQKQEIENPEDIDSVINSSKKCFEIELFNKRINIPAKQEWIKLSQGWNKSTDDFDTFLKNHFIGQNNQSNRQHQKVRKVFSLPVVNTLGHFLQKRRSWDGNDIYQISADSDSRSDGNKFSRLVLTQEGELKEVINQPFESKNMFKLKEEKIYTEDNYYNINPNQWIAIKDDNDFPDGVNKIEYCIDNKTRPQIKIYLSENFDDNNIEEILGNSLTKPKEKAKELKQKLSSNEASVIEYTASGFNKKIKSKLLAVLCSTNKAV